MNYLFAGASSAIAVSAAELLMEDGHRVIGLSTRSSELKYSEVFHVTSYAKDHLPELQDSLDGLVYFPGSINLKPFSRLSKSEFLNDFELNVIGAVEVVQKYLPQLKNSPNPSVVFISSVAAQSGMSFHASISASKAALEGLTRSLAAEFAPQIRFNCVSPSLVNTPLAEKFLNTPEKQDAMSKRNPMKLVGSPLDVAHMVRFLLSSESRWVTGQTFSVDGGMNVLRI